MTVEQQKKTLRRELLAKRRQLDAVQRAERNQKICDGVCSSDAFQRAQVLLCFSSMPEEPDISAIIWTARKMGKQVCYPRCFIAEHSMQFCLISDEKELQTGAYGIPEPSADCAEYIPQPTDLCLVPALAATEDGFRLGYGGGYYDRYLADHTVYTIAICYAFPYSGTLPVERTDMPTDAVICF